MRHRILALLVLVTGLLAFAQAAAPTSFCKCTCFSNSTLIQLSGRRPDEEQPESSGSGKLLMKAGTCEDCNKQFCLKHELPICKEAKVDDVFTTCFQRDSVKDEAVVFIFIFATVGLLAWAILQPYLSSWFEKRKGQQYEPVNGVNDGQ